MARFEKKNTKKSKVFVYHIMANGQGFKEGKHKDLWRGYQNRADGVGYRSRTYLKHFS